MKHPCFLGDSLLPCIAGFLYKEQEPFREVPRNLMNKRLRLKGGELGQHNSQLLREDPSPSIL